MNIQELHNTYFVMRHGQSQANVEELIVSNAEQGIPNYGLTEEGRNQARHSAQKAHDEGVLDENTVIISSDFSRARETAEIAAQVLGSLEVQLSRLLRERNFGTYDGMHNSNYEKIWEKDIKQELHDENVGVESTGDVLKRVGSLIEELEQKYKDRAIVLVSHGDTLQILLTAFSDISTFNHRSLAHLTTAEIRRCN